MRDKFVITRLDQLKAVSDPLRVRLLEALVIREHTITELAKEVGESASKLYHHVDLLHEAGLVEVVARRPKRGTEERWFRAVGKEFTVDDAMFLFGREAERGPEALIELARSLLSGLHEDMAKALRAGRVDPRRPGKRVFLETQEVRLTESEFAGLCRTLDEWIDSARRKSGGRAKRHRYRIGVAFFPLAVALALGAPAPGRAQTASARAASLITEQDVRRRIDLIANDSMRGRNTPSPELELTAAYVAQVFRGAGLRPLGDSGGYFQRYPLVRRRLVPEQSALELAGPGGTARIPFGARLAFAQGSIPDRSVRAPVAVLGGAVTAEAVVPDSVRGRLLVWLVDVTGPGAGSIDGVAGALIQAGPAAVLLVPNDTGFVRGAAARSSRERVDRPNSAGGGFTALAADESAIAGAVPGWDSLFRRLRASPSAQFVATPITATVTFADSVVGHVTAPNVVGVVPGTDPKLADQYVVISAHMDHLGVEPGASPDSIYNGADDNGSGTVGVLEIARAMAAGGRPRRSVIFAIVSGEEKGLWGSEYFVAHSPVPLGAIVADLNLDMIGRNWRDTVGVIGREHSDLGQILDQVAARHRELRVTPVGDRWPDQNRFYRSDHYNFARAGIPILF
jgi:DNA-binding transcriptional ArsR family regulator